MCLDGAKRSMACSSSEAERGRSSLNSRLDGIGEVGAARLEIVLCAWTVIIVDGDRACYG
jgi:hypothetical protein